MKMKGIMLQGTSSDVGKSVLCTALCRLFKEQGLKVAPFKSQNMSNNSYVTNKGEEIGRAQGIQAEAANVEASVYMNPILLKPSNDCTSEVIYFGKPWRTLSGKDYRQQFYELGLEAIEKSKEKLSEQFDYLVVEGAGSPVEINLNDREIVNMKVAEILDIPVILVADIDRGGVFASVVGTLQLLSEEERKRVKGIIINKFRGDLSLFDSGVDWIESYTGKPVLGVVPFMHDLAIESEDSLAIPHYVTKQKRGLDIAVIKLPYVSNFTDLEPFRYEKDVSLRFVDRGEELGVPDAVIIPGTKSTINDLKYLKENKVAEAIIRYVNDGGRIIGICGGYQILGQEILDKAGTDTSVVGFQIEGLGLLPISTQFEEKKLVKHSKGKITIADTEIDVDGYEIHLGQTEMLSYDISSYSSFIKTDDCVEEGVYHSNGKVIGTYFHHLFHNDRWRNYWLNQIRADKKLEKIELKNALVYERKKCLAYEQLGDFVGQYLDIPKVIDIAQQWGENTKC